MNKFTICIITDINVLLKGIFTSHLEALNNIKNIAKEYIQENTLDNNINVSVYEKTLEELKTENIEGNYFLRNEGSSCILYKKDIKNDGGILSYVYNTNIVNFIKLASLSIVNINLLGDVKLVSKDKIFNMKDELSEKNLSIKYLENNIKHLENKLINVQETSRILRVEKSQLQEQVNTLQEQVNTLISKINNVEKIEKNTETTECIRQKPKVLTKVNNLSYIDEMINFLNTQVCDPQENVKASKIRLFNKKIN
ncbi:hypothetical protein Hokovirus_2_198 [Hokovirus HKV1]|uniref:Uncharacterized protein n=1 Tax=Hokovirus HKV1 TaxID=1977638 RepID=A0A1V0SG70_9VIRU|nr:hypothetical protein Hokovirus_2_198 [Hokovirus HKV1]